MTAAISQSGPEPEPPRPALPHRRRWLALALAAVGLALGALAWWWFGRAAKPPVAAAKIEVQVARAEVRAVPVLLQGVGKVVAQHSVEVRAQTAGVLRQVFIQDGQRVVAGQRLFALEAQPLQAALAQAQAQYRRDQALAADAAAAQARLKPLADQEYVTAREYEAAVSNTLSLQAAAAATRTQIEQARIALGYATITAPLAGRAGAVLVKPGNLVAAAASTPLVVINALSPVEVVFSLPQAAAQRLRAAMAAATAAAAGTRLEVEARDSLSQKLRASGELVFIDNALDDSSGTVTVKARFANADEALWPGEFYAVRITLRTDEAAVTVPERALQQGQAGPYVYVLTAGKAVLRPLKVDRVLDGRAVITEGLKVGETVLASVPANLRDGSAVQVAKPASAASAASAASSASAASETPR